MGFSEVRRVPIVVNALCFLTAIVVAAVFLLKPMDAVRQGFFCDDDTIRFPYKGNTISVTLLVITSLLPALILVLTLETTYGVLTARLGGGGGTAVGDMATTTGGDTKNRFEGLKCGLGRAGLLVACLMHGNALCYILTEVFKLSFGRLRPSFLAACQPETDVTSFSNCSGLYVEDVTCLNPDHDLVVDMRKSFVSGHASFVVFNMLFIILYFQLRLPSSTPRLVVSLLQSGAVAYAVFVCATRIYDHYHHPQDVLGGTVLGIVTCWGTVYKICPSFFRHPPRTDLDLLPTTITTKQGTASVSASSHTKE